MTSYCSRISGLPHSSNSPTVSGSDPSSMVVMTSTNGTRSTAAAPALDREPVGRGVAARHEELGGGDEVGEGVALGEHAARVVPALAAFAAAAHVGERHGHAAVEQAHAARLEG